MTLDANSRAKEIHALVLLRSIDSHCSERSDQTFSCVIFYKTFSNQIQEWLRYRHHDTVVIFEISDFTNVSGKIIGLYELVTHPNP